MNWRRCLAFLLCAVLFLSALPPARAGEGPETPAVPAQEEAGTPAPQGPTPPEGPVAPPQRKPRDPDRTPPAQPESTQFVAEPTPFLPEPAPFVPEPTQEPEKPQATEEPREPKRKASKILPSSFAGVAPKSMADQAFDVNVWMSTDYVNLNDNPGTEVLWQATASGGSGSFLYAFDLYKDGALYAFTPEYGSLDTASNTPDEPGSYRMRVFVYDWFTGREIITWSDFLGVSTLRVNGVGCNSYDALTGDLLTFTVDTAGGTGTLKYAYLIEYSTDGSDWGYVSHVRTAYATNNTFTYRPSYPGYFRLEAWVWEEYITYYDLGATGPAVEVTLGPPTLDVDRVIPSDTLPWIGDTVSFFVETYGAQGTVQCVFELYRDGAPYESTGWLNTTSHDFTLPRSGRYYVTAYVRDSAYPAIVYQRSSGTVYVSDLYVKGDSVNKTTACLGDTMTWNIDVEGGSGYIWFIYRLYHDGVKAGTWASDKDSFSAVAMEPGVYSISYEVMDAYCDLEYDALSEVMVTQRPAPVLSEVAAASGTSLKVTWKAVAGSTGYELYRATSAGGAYTKVYTGAALTYTDTGRTAGTAYWYKVRAYKNADGVTYSGLYSAPKAGVPLAAPAAPAGSALSKTSIKLTWAKVTGATGYELLRAATPTGTYTKVYGGTALTFTNTGLKTATTYYYKVRAYKQVGTVKYYGPPSAYRAVKTK